MSAGSVIVLSVAVAGLAGLCLFLLCFVAPLLSYFNAQDRDDCDANEGETFFQRLLPLVGDDESSPG